MSTPRSEIIQQAKILKALIALSEADIILTNFVYSFMNKTIDKGDMVRWLHGNFNLGGTVSGRLSSSKVNLQNLPSSGSKYAKLVKTGFVAPDGWILCGADFSSLEDRISALTTKDPNKLKVYTDKFDGHCLRAAAYFPDKMPDVTKELKLTEADRVFKITQDDGTLIYAKGSVILDSSTQTVEELYDTNTKF